ncbi:MAG: hypothetical protein PHO15_06300 [Eubacteriales bacterium]|nr:hypothetical protein [Eubacteriales bacterium]
MKRKKVFVFFLVLIVSCVLFNLPAMAQSSESSTAASTAAASAKNETVYAMLGYDGSVSQIYVVNQLIGEYTDYGTYTDIKNLSTTSEPVIDGEQITFPDEYIEGGLYYQGTMQGELPMIFDITYYLDGQQVTAQNLAGGSGHLIIEIGYSVNERCDEDVRDGLMAQISMTLDQDRAGHVDADGATVVVIGSTMNISYTVLPGESGTMVVEADINDFEMDAITMMLLKGSVSGIEDTISDLEDGLDDMIDGAEDMVNGTYELKDGITDLADGVSDLSDGMSRLSSSGADIYDGMSAYADGLQAYTEGVDDLATASSQIQAGLDTLASGGADAAGGVSDISDGLSALSGSVTDLRALAESMSSSADASVQALAQGIIQTLDSLSQLAAGLDTASAGVDAYAAAVGQAASEYEAFDAGVASVAAGGGEMDASYTAMKDGFADYLTGIKSSANGTYQLYKSVKDLPESIQELIDGQIEFRDGIVSAQDEITGQTDGLIGDGTPAVSFASPGKNNPDSVQYILTTPAIAIAEQNETEETDKDNDDFLTRLLDLFR